MLWIISILLFLMVFLLLYILIGVAGKKQSAAERLQVYDNVKKMEDQDIFADEELAKPIYERLFSPIWNKMGEKLRKMTPQATYAMFEAKLQAAGGFRDMSTNGFLLFWSFIAILLAFLFGLAAGKSFRLPLNQVIGMGLIGLVIGMILPVAVLSRRIRARKAAMQKSLPPVLDLVYVSVQAGLAFDGAIAKVVEKMRGPLVDEFAHMLQEIRMGMARRDALKNLSDRCQVQDISLFTAALIQADQLGVSIANTLKNQAEAVRVKRQLSIRELALKAPVKMLIPLVFFIFPAIFVVLLGPGVITMMHTLLNR
ncbi:MAG: Type secretion system protein [Firmicutes bacterium]|nr:Type secretion system protein [Bacillota bacterium]